MTIPPEDPPSSTVQESASSASNKPQTLSAWIRRPQAIVFTLIGLFILTCGIYISLGYRHFESTRRNALLADKTMANLLAVVIEEHERAVIGILQSYAGRPLFIEIVKRKDPVAARRHLAELKKQHEIDFTLVTDKNGVSWANYPVFPEVIGKDLSHLDWYKGISSNWKPYISTVLKLVVLDKPLAIVICVPVFDEKGRPIGILSSSQRLTFLSDIIQQVPFNPYTGVTVIDRTGHILYNNKYPQQKENTEYASYPIIEQALKEKRQQVELTDPQKGQAKSYLAVVPIEGIGWTVIVDRGLKDIFRSEYKNYIMTGAFPLLLFLLVSFFLVYSRKVFLFRKTEELLQAEVRFRSLFESMSSGVTIYQATDDGEDFIILDHNEAAQRITHVYKDFIGKRVSDIFPGVKDFGLLQVFQQVWRTGKAEFFPSALYKDDRLTYWAENYVYKLPSGEIVTIFDDVTEHKQAEDDLQESEEKYRVFFETSRDCVFITSKDGSWIDFNDAAVQFFGYESRDELKEVKIQHLYHDEQDRKRHTQEITQRGFSRDYAVDLRKKDGSIIHTLITSVPKKDKSGEIIGYQGTIKDVTDQRRAAEALKEAFNFLQQLIDALPVPLFYKDSKGIYLGCNKAFEQFFGQKREEITGKSVYDISPKELADIYHEQDMALLQSQGVQIYESSVKDTGGVVHNVIFHKATFPNVDGSVGGLIGAILDITERKQAEQSQALVNRILEILNNPGEIINLIRNILLLLKEHTGIEAIGVRLREVEDFPYYETNGFPPHFIESEKYLCARDDAGEIMCDSHGIPCLECICGNVICGRTDPALPFFTEGGSFWTNSTTKLLASATEEDRKTWTRNRCHSEGYESVALIPLRSGEEIIGLLQLNDKQPDRFTLGMIQSLEGIGTSIGIALHRLQAEQAIGKSEEKYRLVVDNTAEAIIITQDEKLAFVNRATEDIIGYSAAILTSRSFIDFIHPDDRNTVVGYHIKRLKGEEVPIVYDFRVVCQDGTVKWLEQNGVVIQWDKRPATLNFLSDITERKRAEDELRDSEEKYRPLASTADLMFLVDRDCRYLFMNEKYAERFDLPIEKFIGRTYGDFHSEEITKTFSQIIGTVLRTGESVQHEYKSDRDGKFFLQTLTPVKDREGKAITAVTVLSKDITERKEAEKALRQAEADYRSIFENSQEGIYRSTSEGKFIAANQSMANILGYDSPGDLINGITDISRQIYVYPEDRQVLLKMVKEHGSVKGFETQFYRKDGSKIWVSITMRDVHDAEGIVQYYEGNNEDITARKKAEEKLLRTLSELQETRDQLIRSEKLAAAGTLSTGVAHEILNPVNIISIKLQLIGMTETLSDKAKSDVEVCKDQIARITKITTALNEFARVSVQQVITGDLNRLIDDMVVLVAPRLKFENVRTAIQCQPDLPLIQMDKGRMGQVIFNLIANALDAMHNKEEKTLHISTELKDENIIRLVVSDTGTGMKPEILNKIFDPFFTTKEPGKGTGLGLSISHVIIHDHAGKIWAENNEWGGASFFIELPIKLGKAEN